MANEGAMMGNPHPTKSKPCKIGRKHTNAPSTRVREKRRRAKQKQREIALAQFRKHKSKIEAYWRGETDECPPSLRYSQKGTVFQRVYSSGEHPRLGDIVSLGGVTVEHEVVRVLRSEVKLFGVARHVELTDLILIRRQKKQVPD